MKKTELLEAIQTIKMNNAPDIGPKKVTNLVNKDVLVKEMKTSFVPKADKKGQLLANIKNINKDIAKPESKPSMESREWKPAITSVEELTKRILIEAETDDKRKPNAFRLNLQPVVLDSTHAKMDITRNGKVTTAEIMYPNANGKITVKIQVDGAEDKLVEVGLDSPEYRTNLGVYIIKLIDESIEESGGSEQAEMDEYLYADRGAQAGEAPMGTGIDGRGSNIGAGSPIWESDRTKMNALLSIVEAKDDEELAFDEPTDEGGDEGGDDLGDLDLGGDAEGGEEAFGEGDFAMDAGADTETSDEFDSDFGFGGGGGGDFGGGDFGGDGAEGGDINADDQEGGAEDVDFMTFKDKTDWLQSALDTMQNLVATSMGQKMGEGKGVILTSDEILNGTSGLRNVDKPVDIVDKFLQIYVELDNIDLKEEQLAQIEEKLSLNDNQFDGWLAQKMPEFTNEEEVNDTLNNEMFSDFDPMGGEDMGEGEEENLGDMDFQDFLEETEPEEESSSKRTEAELDIGSDLPAETSEFPNVEEEGGFEEEKPEEKK